MGCERVMEKDKEVGGNSKGEWGKECSVELVKFNVMCRSTTACTQLSLVKMRIE